MFTTTFTVNDRWQYFVKMSKYNLQICTQVKVANSTGKVWGNTLYCNYSQTSGHKVLKHFLYMKDMSSVNH